METGKYYSIRDLTNVSGQPRNVVREAVNFLTQYGFVRTIGKDPLFHRSQIIISPTQTLKMLQDIEKEEAEASTRIKPATT